MRLKVAWNSYGRDAPTREEVIEALTWAPIHEYVTMSMTQAEVPGPCWRVGGFMMVEDDKWSRHSVAEAMRFFSKDAEAVFEVPDELDPEHRGKEPPRAASAVE